MRADGCGTIPRPRRVRGAVPAPGAGVEATSLGRSCCARLGNARRDRGALLARRRRAFVKDDGATRRFAREDSIERDLVQGHEASEHGVESLDEGDGPRLASLDAERLGLLLLPPP
jgi:hypothetical protein